MKDFIENLMTKKTMKPTNIAIAILLGIGLIVAANPFLSPGEPSGGTQEPTGLEHEAAAQVRGEARQQAERTQPASHEEMLERRLESILRTVEGVGNVRVMITLVSGSSRVYAENIVRSDTSVSEIDSAGGRRDQRDVSGQHTTLTVSRDGNQEPVLIREYEPVVEGVIISAQGAGNARIRAELSAAAQAVLGVEEHKVQVLIMISGGR